MHQALVARPGTCIRRLGMTRAGEMRFTRFLRNGSVSVGEMASYASERTALGVAGRDVVAIADRSELILGGGRRRREGYGPVGRGGSVRGLLLQVALAVEAGTGALLGLVDIQVWNRIGGKVTPRRGRATSEKESQGWLDSIERSHEVLSAASQVTAVIDAEGDFYELFASCPSSVQLLVRAAQNRRVKTGKGDPAGQLLFEFADALPEQGRFSLSIPAAPGRPARTTQCAVRFAPVQLRKPRHGAARELPQTLSLTLVDIREVTPPDDGKPLHWRLLTSHSVTSLNEAYRIRDLYRQRWVVEEFFRTLKTAGFDIEQADIGDPKAMINLVAAATVAAVTVMQLVQARDGTSNQRLADAFEADDQPILEALCTRLEGKTDRQRNPHPKASLAFASWVIARLGGWTGYYGKPGPRVMRRGLEDFRHIKYGSSLRLQNV